MYILMTTNATDDNEQYFISKLYFMGWNKMKKKTENIVFLNLNILNDKTY